MTQQQVPQNARWEIKFVTHEVHKNDILHWLNSHYCGFKSAFPERWVNNVYFDSFDLKAYEENLSGASSRTKVRYRWYGESTTPEPGILEVKQKRNCYGWKLLFPIKQALYRQGADWTTIRRLLLQQLPANGKNWIQANPVPVLLNRYHRQYFISNDQKIRVTVDSDQLVFDQRTRRTPNFQRSTPPARTIVVEFKFDRNDSVLGSKIIQGIPIRVSRHSKYVNGVMSTSLI